MVANNTANSNSIATILSTWPMKRNYCQKTSKRDANQIFNKMTNIGAFSHAVAIKNYIAPNPSKMFEDAQENLANFLTLFNAS